MSQPGLLLPLLSLAALLAGPSVPANVTPPPGRPAGAGRVAAIEPHGKTDAEKQKQTVADIRNLGTALFSWLTDQVGASAAGQQNQGSGKKEISVDLKACPAISRAELQKLLVPQYIQKVPETDGWGHPYEVRLNVKDVLAKQVMSIRSPGRDGVYSSDTYTVQGFSPTDFDQDIVWADGYFVRWPQKP
ncbi:MAG TPA: hypothetical protein VF173_19270 [Thermoanaerobaculia bacterium]|nr:hypothetical protein [Thermoanaerobaculia bacterium]